MGALVIVINGSKAVVDTRAWLFSVKACTWATSIHAHED